MKNRLTKYVYDNRIFWILLLIFTVIIRAPFFLNTNVGIDTEEMIALQKDFYGGWLGIGRYALIFLKHITDTVSFNPYLSGVLVLLLIPVVCILWTFLLELISGRENKAATMLFSVLMVVSTIMTEQLYFKLQAMEVCIVLCTSALTLIFSYYALYTSLDKKKKYIYLATSSLLNILNFGSYQVLIPLYIFGVAMVCFMHLYYSENDAYNTRTEWQRIFSFIGLFICSFVINQILVNVFKSNDAKYIGDQIFWGTRPLGDCLYSIVAHIGSVLLGTQIYYVKTYSVYVLILLIYVVRKSISKKQTGRTVLLIICFITMMAGPFYMTIICGNTPVLRSQMVLPFATAFLAYMSINGRENTNNKIFSGALLVLAVVSVYLQLEYTERLIYSDQVRYESDVRLANQLSSRIDVLQDEDKSYTVIFYGKHEAELNGSCIRGEMCGKSLFEWDVDVEPYGFYNSKRALFFMNALGIKYKRPTDTIAMQYYQYIEDMPCWPQEDSIKQIDDVIIVKFSDYE